MILAPVALFFLQAVYPHASEKIGTVREVYEGKLSPEMAVSTFRNIDRLFATRTIPRSDHPLPLPKAETPLAELSVVDLNIRYSFDQFLDLNRISGLLVLQDGKIKLERYRYGNTQQTRWMSMSVAKSITSTLIGAAIKDGLLKLTDSVTKYVPELKGSAYDGVIVRDLLMMTSGAKWDDDYTHPNSERRKLLDAQISQTAGSAIGVLSHLSRVARPGTVNNYSTGETQVAAEVLRRAVHRSLSDYLSEKIWSKVGMEADAKWWLDSPDGTEIGGSGFSATLRDYGRFGLFIMGGGHADGEAILPDGWVREATTPKVLKGGKPLDYGYMWWTAATHDAKRDHAFAAEGINGQWIYINPVTKVVIVVWSAQSKPTGGAVVDDWVFFDAVSAALARH